MKILLDESLPRKLKAFFGTDHKVYSVRDMGWLGQKNGALLKLMQEESFDIFVTVDRNLTYQQNTKELSITIVVLIEKDNRLETLATIIPKLLTRINESNLSGLIEIS